jgi:hypothetical protein
MTTNGQPEEGKTMQALPKQLNILRIIAAIQQERQALAQRREHQWMAKAIEDRIAMEMQLPAPPERPLTRREAFRADVEWEMVGVEYRLDLDMLRRMSRRRH